MPTLALQFRIDERNEPFVRYNPAMLSDDEVLFQDREAVWLWSPKGKRKFAALPSHSDAGR